MLKIASAHVSWVSANDSVMSSKVILHLQKKNELIGRVGERTLSLRGLNTWRDRLAGVGRERLACRRIPVSEEWKSVEDRDHCSR